MAIFIVRDEALEVVVDFTPPAQNVHEICVPGQYDEGSDVRGDYRAEVNVPGTFGVIQHDPGSVGATFLTGEFQTEHAVTGSIPECNG